MVFLYNLLQFILLPFALPVLLPLILVRRKYRKHIPGRLGLHLHRTATVRDNDRKRIWIHCLSVGEVTSALPLIREIRLQMKDVAVFLSVATRAGLQVARDKAGPHADAVFPGPLDLLPTVNRFITHLRPDLFILVETDFWPNWLFLLRRKNIPAMLVNGRISRTSFARYQRFRLFFGPLFNTFSRLAVQTGQDREQLIGLGADPWRITTPGNLKYGTLQLPVDGTLVSDCQDIRLPADHLIWVCGSTHRGEEDILLESFAILHREIPSLSLVMAPRDPDRAAEIASLATARGLETMRRSRPQDPPAPVLILDTLGELAEFYSSARLAFVGGSLVSSGGHNPLEAAVRGVPVFFGPHMEDFAEIASDLVRSGGGFTVRSGEEITALVRRLVQDEQFHVQSGRAALDMVEQNSAVIGRCLDEIRRQLESRQN
jgi:3-deoxy-D-manno-octulosonic-acid transferase